MKSKIVSFRLSEAEYSAVEQMSQKQRCGSVALFARSATLAGALAERESGARNVDAERLWRNLEAITGALDTLVATLLPVLRTMHEAKAPTEGVSSGNTPSLNGCQLIVPG